MITKKFRQQDLFLHTFQNSAKAYAIEHADPLLIPPWTLTHTRHPCTVWTSENTGNYEWHVQLMRALLDEYTIRYNKVHKSESVYEWLNSKTPFEMLESPKTEHPQCMPEDCKVVNDPVKAYRNYYIHYKKYMAVWEPKSVTPKWFKEAL